MKRIIGKIAFGAVCAALIAGTYTAAEAADSAAPQKLEAAKQSYLASIRAEALAHGEHAPESVNAGSPSQWLTRVDADEVNMVTNRLDDHATSVTIAGNAYSVGEHGYADTLKKNPSLTAAIDPITGHKVDKAEAAIFADASGRVFYFESDTSFKRFLALGESTTDTVFGYSSPR